MAREVTERLRCDFCESVKRVKSYTLTQPGKVAVVDLCGTCQEPFEQALKIGDNKPRRVAPSYEPNRRRHAVIPID